MFRKNIFIFCFLLAGIVFTASYGQCENWKEFFNDGYSSWQYDKDSIHYPKQTKNFIGVAVRDKNIVNVWLRERHIVTGKTESARQTFYCAERQCFNSDGNVFGDLDAFESHAYSGGLGGIQPGSKWEILLKKVCP